MKNTLLLASLLLIPLGESNAAGPTSPVVGILKFSCPAGSDTVVSIPFHRTPRWEGSLASPPSNPASGTMRLTLTGTPGFSAGELTASPHFLYCRDLSAPGGRHFLILAHGSDSVDISVTAEDLGTLTTGGLISVIPAWTLETLLPAATQTTLHRSSGPLATQRKSELLFFDNAGAGVSLAPSHRFFVTAESWFEVGTFSAAGNTILDPGQAFIIRHPQGVEGTALIANQQVYGGVVSAPLRVAAAGARDTMLALPRPVTITLGDLDFAPGQFVESPGTGASDRRDEILVYDNTATGLNKEPASIYFRSGGQWLHDGTNTVADADPVAPSSGLLIRKATGSTDEVLFWSNAPTYDVTAP